MSDDKTPLDQALDLFLYLPVGLALAARDELPKLIEKGRQRVGNEVGMARMIGQFAVTQGQKEADKALRRATERLSGPPPGRVPPTPPTSSPRPASSPSEATGAASASAGTSAAGTSAAGSNGSVARAAATPAATPVAELAIPGYDTLSASQVVPRLAGLAPAELEAVRSYEAATRGRRTILTRVAQLQSGQTP